MNSFERVLNSSWLLISFQAVLALSLITNIYYTDRINSCNILNDQVSSLNDSLNQELSRYDSLEAYENSAGFQDKSLKNRGYKLKDEVVVDTSSVEPLPENPEYSFIPKAKSKDANNIVSWVNYFSGKRSDTSSNLTCS